MNNMNWHSVKDELPTQTGWYLVYAPGYRGGSSGGREYYDGLMFSKYNIAKNGNNRWSVETCYWRNKNCVKFWMPLPEKPVVDEPEEEINSKYKQLEFPFENNV